MFLFGDIARTSQLLHSSDISELMAEPPVAGRARKQVRPPAAVAHLVPSPELDAPVSETPGIVAPVAVSAPRELPRHSERAAA